MDIRERHFGPIATQDGAGQMLVDIGALIRRLILFEQCTIESIGLKEVPALISVFGADGFLKLIDSGAVRIVCDLMTAGQVGQTGILKSAEARGGVLPLGSYRIVSVGIPKDGEHRKKYIHEPLQEIHKSPISFKEAKKVKRALASRLMDYSFEAGNAGVVDTQVELRHHHPVIWTAIKRAVFTSEGIGVSEDPDFSVEMLGMDGDFRVATGLARYGLTPEQEHEQVGRGILAVASLNQRIHLMETFGAVTGFQEQEAPLFEEKMSYVLRQVDPAVQEQRFERVATIGGLPGVDGLPAGSTIDVDRLLKLRDEPECREFRTWIRNVDSETDDEIKDRFESVRGRFADVIESRGGKRLRFLVTAGAGLIPVAGAVVGPALSAGDTFLLDKIVGKPGPAVFLSKHYPTIFQT
jgi:hypothetical protein